MKREFLKELGLTDEQIEKVMAEHGKGIEKFKEDLDAANTQTETLQEQLKTANEMIEEFKGMDIEAIKQAAEDYKAKYEKATQEAEEKLNKIKFDYALEKALTGAKARNIRAVKALLDLENLKLADDKILGLDEQLEKIKEENDFLFKSEDNQKLPKFVGPGGDDTKTSTGTIDISKLAEQASIRK